MRKTTPQFLIGLLLLLPLFVSCDDDEVSCTTHCGHDNGDGDGDGDETPGCYDPVEHHCDCETDESSCTADEGIWTDECACTGSDGDGMGGGSGIEPSAGCYDSTTHQCNCGADESSCVTDGGTWTEQCACEG